jgi:hypothetical protein
MCGIRRKNTLRFGTRISSSSHYMLKIEHAFIIPCVVLRISIKKKKTTKNKIKRAVYFGQLQNKIDFGLNWTKRCLIYKKSLIYSSRGLARLRNKYSRRQ